MAENANVRFHTYPSNKHYVAECNTTPSNGVITSETVILPRSNGRRVQAPQ